MEDTKSLKEFERVNEQEELFENQYDDKWKDYMRGYSVAERKYKSKIAEVKRKNEKSIKELEKAYQRKHCLYTDTYPFNVIYTMLNVEKIESMKDFDFSARSILTVFNEHLSAKENQILRLRFEERLTLEEISKIDNVSRERVRQIETNALEKLRKTSILEQIKVVNKIKYNELLAMVDELKRENQFMKSLFSTSKEEKEKQIVEINHKVKPIYIYELKLCNTVNNSLARANIHTLHELSEYIKKDKELKNIKGFGKASKRHLIEKLKENGFDFRDLIATF